MGLFYAYLKSSQYDEVWRYLITFADRETADEWWRVISTAPSPFVGYAQRISPQFYTHNTDKINLGATFFNQPTLPDAKQFLNKIFFTLVNDRDGRILSIAPPIDVTDHISGEWYFIRSKATPAKYWYSRINDGTCLVCGLAGCDKVHVSALHRTKFLVQVRNLEVKNFVIIGKDEITIAASKDYALHINDGGDLQLTKYQSAISDLLFGDLKDRFVTRGKAVGVTVGASIQEYIAPVDRGLGEAWELAK